MKGLSDFPFNLNAFFKILASVGERIIRQSSFVFIFFLLNRINNLNTQKQLIEEEAVNLYKQEIKYFELNVIII